MEIRWQGMTGPNFSKDGQVRGLFEYPDHRIEAVEV